VVGSGRGRGCRGCEAQVGPDRGIGWASRLVTLGDLDTTRRSRWVGRGRCRPWRARGAGQHRVRAATSATAHPTDNQPHHLAHSQVAGAEAPEGHRLGTRRARRGRNFHVTAGGDIRVDRQRARPYDGHRWRHRLGPLPDAADNCAEGVPRVQGPAILSPIHAAHQPALPTIRRAANPAPQPPAVVRKSCR